MRAGKRAIRSAVKKRWAAFHAKAGAAKPAEQGAKAQKDDVTCGQGTVRSESGVSEGSQGQEAGRPAVRLVEPN
jgi:hypothetical protein